MRITILSGPFLPMPPAPCGAVERVWDGLAKVFAHRGHRVTVLCRRHPTQAADETIDGVRYVRRTAFARPARLGAALVKDFVYSCRMFAQLPEADILVTNTFWTPFLLNWWNPSAGRIAVHVARVPKRQMWLYSCVHRFQAVSEAIRDEIVKQVPRFQERVRVFPNPIYTDVFTPPEDGREGRAHKTILFTGRIHPEKGLDLLIEAFRLLSPEFPNLRLRIVGPWRTEHGGGGADYLAQLRARAPAAGVEFGEPVFDLARLAAIYQSADYYCYPTLAEQGEASPVAPLEAMASGLVPVVSDIPQFRDSVRNGECGVTFPHRGPGAARALADAIRGLIVAPEWERRLARAAVQKARERGYDRVADLYLDDFATMLRAGGRQRWTRTATNLKR